MYSVWGQKVNTVEVGRYSVHPQMPSMRFFHHSIQGPAGLKLGPGFGEAFCSGDEVLFWRSCWIRMDNVMQLPLLSKGSPQNWRLRKWPFGACWPNTPGIPATLQLYRLWNWDVLWNFYQSKSWAWQVFGLRRQQGSVDNIYTPLNQWLWSLWQTTVVIIKIMTLNWQVCVCVCVCIYNSNKYKNN